MSTLTLFYKNPDNLNKFLPIISGKSRISLRLIDWFVTNYSKKENVIFPLESSEGKITQFIVHTNYKSQLKAYSKKHFDPFCRGENIRFCYDEKLSKSVISTVGQLNFFRWIISNKIIHYIENNVSDIERDMTQSVKLCEDSMTSLTKKKKNDGSQKALMVDMSQHDNDEQMDVSNSIDKQPNSADKVKTHRKQLSISATRTVLKHDCKLVVEFG